VIEVALISTLRCVPPEGKSTKVRIQERDSLERLLNFSELLLDASERLYYRPKTSVHAVGTLSLTRVLMYHIHTDLEKQSDRASEFQSGLAKFMNKARDFYKSVHKSNLRSSALSCLLASGLFYLLP